MSRSPSWLYAWCWPMRSQLSNPTDGRKRHLPTVLKRMWPLPMATSWVMHTLVALTHFSPIQITSRLRAGRLATSRGTRFTSWRKSSTRPWLQTGSKCSRSRSRIPSRLVPWRYWSTSLTRGCQTWHTLWALSRISSPRFSLACRMSSNSSTHSLIPTNLQKPHSRSTRCQPRALRLQCTNLWT